MKTNKATRLGDKKAKYPESRASVRGRRNFPWVHKELGRVAKILIMLIGSKVVEIGETVDRNYRSAGLTKEELYSELIRFLPWLPGYYKRTTKGNALTPHIVRQRFYMMYLNGTGKGECRAVSMGGEHPLNQKDLRPLVPGIEVLFKRNRRVTPTEAFAAGRIKSGFKTSS